jgi:hypothetical protein
VTFFFKFRFSSVPENLILFVLVRCSEIKLEVFCFTEYILCDLCLFHLCSFYLLHFILFFLVKYAKLNINTVV